MTWKERAEHNKLVADQLMKDYEKACAERDRYKALLNEIAALPQDAPMLHARQIALRGSEIPSKCGTAISSRHTCDLPKGHIGICTEG